MPERHAKGEKAGLAKLTDNKVRQMRQMVAEGMSMDAASRWAGVHSETGRTAIKGTTWKHVKPLLSEFVAQVERHSHPDESNPDHHKTV